MATSKTPSTAPTTNPSTLPQRPGSITVSVLDKLSRQPISDAWIGLFRATAGTPGKMKDLPGKQALVASGRTGGNGQIEFDNVQPATYLVGYGHHPVTDPVSTTVDPGCSHAVCLEVAVEAGFDVVFKGANCEPLPCERPRVGDQVFGSVSYRNSPDPNVTVVPPPGAQPLRSDPLSFALTLRHMGPTSIAPQLLFAPLGEVAALGVETGPAALALEAFADVDERPTQAISGGINVSMTRTETEPTADMKLWGAIKASTEGMAFDRFDAFMDELFCHPSQGGGFGTEKARFGELVKRRFLPFTDTDAYRLLKAATEAFVIVNCGIFPLDGETQPGDFLAYLDRRDLPRPGRTPYLENVEGLRILPYLAIIRRKLPDVPIAPALEQIGVDDANLCEAFVRGKLRNPCLLELIWSYWQEEGMLVQTMNTIARRFQNLRGLQQPDPLANVEVNPLRPLNNLLWGVIQDEQHRLSVARRNAEYDHHYGLRLEGRAVQGFRGADTRSKFIEAFHHLLRLCTEFYKQDDDTTVKADAFGVLNAIKEVHLILSQGAHSQFGDLPATARTEMLMQQWLLARPEFREFLPTRAMVAYPEPWMDRVDAMKKLMGWSDTSVVHFHNLAVFGEQVLLAIRYGAWSTVFEPTQAFNFARFWRPQIQGYIHAYRAATGVELGAAAVTQQVDATLPSLLLQRRLASQRRSA
ncbi:MAG: 8-amino-7-oxononanoate synthase [Piscinibacter sp.]|nr:8-amino-7-oxononanoate synthase [Piscinibacter sp.]